MSLPPASSATTFAARLYPGHRYGGTVESAWNRATAIALGATLGTPAGSAAGRAPRP